MSDKIECPLCCNKKFAVLRRFGFDVLARIWKNKVGFNPFPKTEDGAELKKLMCMECGLVYYTPQIIGDGSFYSRLSKFDWYYPRDKWDFDTAINLIKEHKPNSVLEVGCGAGEFLARINGCVDSALGLDINESALSIARGKGLNVSNQDIHSLDKSFDMIFLFQVLEHLESPKEIISALVDKLNPGGCLVLAVPNPDGYYKFVDIVFLDMPPHHTTCWSKDTFQYLANAHQLKMINYECEPLNYRYLRSILIAQISQDDMLGALKFAEGAVKFVQKVLTVLMFPFIYASRDMAKSHGQTHLVVMKKASL